MSNLRHIGRKWSNPNFWIIFCSSARITRCLIQLLQVQLWPPIRKLFWTKNVQTKFTTNLILNFFFLKILEVFWFKFFDFSRSFSKKIFEEEKGLSLEQIGLQICSYITFDSEVFEHFYENDEKLFSLFSTIYFPTLTEFFTEYCNRLEEANRVTSLKPNDGGRELIMETWRKRGMKYHADYTKIVEARVLKILKYLKMSFFTEWP